MGLDLRNRQRGGVVAAMLVPEGIAGATSVHSSRRRLLPGCRGWRNRGCYVEAQSLSRRHGGKHKMRMRAPSWQGRRKRRCTCCDIFRRDVRISWFMAVL